MPHNRGLIVADGGLQIPSGAVVGAVAVSDASGNIAWQEFPEFKSWTVYGTIAVPSGDTNYIPPIFVNVPAWNTLSLVKCRYVIHTGTSVTFDLQRNGASITGFTGLSATTTAATTTGSQALANDDLIQPVVTAISGTPANLTIEIVMQ